MNNKEQYTKLTLSIPPITMDALHQHLNNPKASTEEEEYKLFNDLLRVITDALQKDSPINKRKNI